jgi:predicted enzyme related to lactoylglutathione lyase
MTGSSTQGIKTVLHPVSDLATAKEVYAALLGVPPQTDESYYVGFEAAGLHIGLVPGGGPQGMTSPVAYWHVPDIEAKLAEVTAAGATGRSPRTTSVAAGWWPPSPTPTATCSGCFRTGECRPRPRRHRRQEIVWRRASTRTQVTCWRRPWPRSGLRPTISCWAE